MTDTTEPTSTESRSTEPTSTEPTTVVLVHGAFADASGWAAVLERLQAAGVPARAVVNPLRGIATDAGYVASLIRQIPGPVLAVGHSYGGAVITNAAAPNVVGLVYVAAFAPDEGESLGEIEARSADSVLPAALRPAQYPDGPDGATAVELSIDPAQFHAAFAADLPASVTAVLGVSQRPIAVAAFEEKTGVPAWRALPSWAVVATADKAAGSDVVRSMAERAGAQITEVDASHVPMMSRPDVVTDVILAALRAVG
jgi:pimeloyl-ACP methyl ester carboxylesterase